MKRCLLALAACVPATETTIGPVIRVRVIPSMSVAFTHESRNARMSRDALTNNYDFTLVVDASFGTAELDGELTYTPVSDIAGTITPPGTQLTAESFVYDPASDALHTRTFVGMLSISGTLIGEVAAFHVRATDELGLASNIVDFGVLLY
jgi:hypothetical protein